MWSFKLPCLYDHRYYVYFNQPLLHIGPVNPPVHWHMKPSRRSTHVPPFRHGMLAHSSMSISTNKNIFLRKSLQFKFCVPLLWCNAWLHCQLLGFRDNPNTTIVSFVNSNTVWDSVYCFDDNEKQFRDNMHKYKVISL